MCDAVLYLRYSSDKQTEQSIEGQRRVCMEFAQREGYRIIEEYIDRAKSGKQTAKRTDFARMIKDSDKRKFQAVIVYKLDRFARNRYDSATYKAKLKRNGVRVISATENISDSPEGIILESVLEGMAEFYSAELSQKVTRGMTETALKGNSCGGTIPLGYKVENKKLVEDPLTSHIVQEAFARYADGDSITNIVNDFNARGFRTSRGNLFNKCSFHSMFQNRKYIGYYIYNDIELENAVPALVSEEVFAAAQRRMSEKKHAVKSGKAKVDYALTGKLFCGHCGAPMIGDSGYSKTADKTYYYYACQNQRKHKCDKKPMPKEYIERAVVKEIYNLLTPEFIDKLADMCIKANQEDIKKDERIPLLQEELEKVENKINNLLDMIEDGARVEGAAERLNKLTDQKSALCRQLEDAQGDIIILEKPHIVWWLTRFADRDPTDEQYCRDLINMLVNRVVVWDDPDGYRITVDLNTTESVTEVNSDMDFHGSPAESYPNFIPQNGGKLFRYSAKIGRV